MHNEHGVRLYAVFPYSMINNKVQYFKIRFKIRQMMDELNQQKVEMRYYMIIMSKQHDDKIVEVCL